MLVTLETSHPLMSSLNEVLPWNAFDMSVTSDVHLLSRRFNFGPQGADCREENNIRVSCYWSTRVYPPVMLRCPVLLCPPAHHIDPFASSLLACSSNYLPVRDVAVCAYRKGLINKPEIKCRSEATIVEAEFLGARARAVAGEVTPLPVSRAGAAVPLFDSVESSFVVRNNRVDKFAFDNRAKLRP